MPEEAQVRRVWLDPALSEVTIEADDPKSAVGQKGSNIQQLRNEIGWLRILLELLPGKQNSDDIRRFRKDLAEERKTRFENLGPEFTGLRDLVLLG